MVRQGAWVGQQGLARSGGSKILVLLCASSIVHPGGLYSQRSSLCLCPSGDWSVLDSMELPKAPSALTQAEKHEHCTIHADNRHLSVVHWEHGTGTSWAFGENSCVWLVMLWMTFSKGKHTDLLILEGDTVLSQCQSSTVQGTVNACGVPMMGIHR